MISKNDNDIAKDEAKTRETEQPAHAQVVEQWAAHRNRERMPHEYNAQHARRHLRRVQPVYRIEEKAQRPANIAANTEPDAGGCQGDDTQQKELRLVVFGVSI